MALKTLFSRMSKAKTVLLSTLMALLIACTALAFAFPMTRHANADEIFQCPNAITLEKDTIAFDGFLENRTGYAFSTTENATSFTLADKMSGEFYVEFIPVSSQRGVDDFNKFSFLFTEENSRLAFTVSFSAHTNGVLMSLSLSNTNQVKKEMFTEGSFSNLSDQPIKFKFDPVNMIISDASGVVLANLKDAESQNSFKMGATFDSFVEYSVDMTFSDIASGKTAKVVLFDIAGQSLSGETLTDTSAPLVVGEPKLNNAVKGSNYVIDTMVKTYDVIDGYNKQFKGDIKVFDSKNEEVAIENGAFVPASAQTYYVNYIPKDQAGNVGDAYVCPVVAFETRPEIDFTYEFLAEDVTVGNGALLAFPAVTAKSDLMLTYMPVSATLKLGDVSVYQLTDATKGFDYEFDKVGTYTLTYSATDATGAVRNDVYTIDVNNDKIFDGFEFDREYRKNANIDLTSVAVRGEEVAVSFYAVYPDGRTYQNVTGLALDVEGMYTITATATLDSGATISQTKYFNVKTDNAYLWKETDGLTVTSNAKAPDYADEEYNGTMLTVDRPLEAHFTNIINLKDNTASDILLETFVAPTTAGTKEIDTIEFVFTDIYDEENYIIIRLQWGPWQYYPERMSIIAGRDHDWEHGNPGNRDDHNNQPHQIHYKNMVWATLSGKISSADAQYPSQKISFFFDYESGLLYATPAATPTNTFKAVVGDFTDTRYDPIGKDNPFCGFTTGEVRLSVKFSNLYGVANVMVLNVDGQSMAGQYATDNVAPSVFVDYQGNTEDNLPVAKVNEYFTLFPAYAEDVAGGRINNVTTSVYKLLENGSWEEIAKETDRFMPDTVGQYKITYTTKDAVGNVGTKDVILNAVNSISEIKYEFSTKNPTNLVVGNEYAIYNGKAKGGSGALFENLKVMFEGEEISLDEYGCFVPVKAGEYKLVVTVKDYIGEAGPWEHIIVAEYDDAPILNPVTIPVALRLGAIYEIPTFSAIDYSDEGAEDVVLDTYINGQLVEGSYKTTQEDANAGAFTLTLKHGQTEVISYQVKVLDGVIDDENSHYIFRYFDDNADSKTIDNNGVTFNFTKDTTINIAEKVDVRFLRVKFGFLKANGIASLDLTMIDSVDPSAKVTLTLKPNSTTKSFAVLNGKTLDTSGSFLDGGVLFDGDIIYNYKNHTINCANSNLGAITLTDDGRVFNGFPSGEVYISLKFNGVTEESSIIFKQVSGQNTISSITSGKNPTIEVLGENPRIELNDTITIFPAVAYELLEGVKTVTVTVSAPGGEVLIDNEPADMYYQIKAEKFGSYTIVYKAESYIGRIRTKREAVAVANRQPPVITVNGEIPTGVKLGTTLDIPTATVVASTDECLLSILYLRPDDGYMLVKDSKVTFNQKGTWLIAYFAQDDEGVSSIKMFKITVV